MLLVIPSITIRDGVCVGDIGYPQGNNSLPHFDLPEDRARLLRKENAKAIHLIFEGDKEWNPNILEIIRKVRTTVDIPIEISLSSLPTDISDLKYLTGSGIYRLFLPPEVNDQFVTNCISELTCQKIAVSIPSEDASEAHLKQLKNDGIIRVCITLADDNNPLPVEELRQIAERAKNIGLRLSLLFGVHSYKELMQLSGLEPGFDSVILGSALERNAFPCEGIWRENEMRASLSGNNEANLWKNPVEAATV